MAGYAKFYLSFFPTAPEYVFPSSDKFIEVLGLIARACEGARRH